MNSTVIVAGGFDALCARDLRFLEAAARLGNVTALLGTDVAVQQQTGKEPGFPFPERRYLLEAVRYVQEVIPVESLEDRHLLAHLAGTQAHCWVDAAAQASEARRRLCADHGLAYNLVSEADISDFPEPPPGPSAPGRKKIVATGCYDWFHSGHVRFTQELNNYGDVYIIVGHDANIRLLKGEGHPLFGQDERRYVVGSIKYVKQALISSGSGWLDADPEIQRVKPDIYAVNEDGDKGGKRDYCLKNGIEYLVLERTPAPGLPGRSSTNLRGY